MNMKIYTGSIDPASNDWKPAPLAEMSLIRTEGTTGPLQVGFWRTSATAHRCHPDGSCLAAGNAPMHDAVLVLEGSGTITIPSTGRQVRIEPGLIVSHPQGIETHWDVGGPYLKKLFVEWLATEGAEEGRDIFVGHVADDPEEWNACKWTEASFGTQHLGEAYLIRQEGDPDMAMVGIWRGGVGISESGSGGLDGAVYSGADGDTSLLLLEGRVRVRNEETEEQHEFKAGDVIGFSQGLVIRWTNVTPFVKCFFVVTRRG